MTENTTTPGPAWDAVAPLLARWRMALIPHQDGTWDVLTGYDSRLLTGVFDVHLVPFAGLPQAIAALAARCAAAAREEEG